jgi:hypothetical protein
MVLQRSMHGATIGDAQQVLSLAFTQRSAQQELPRDVVNLSRAIPALRQSVACARS